MNPSAGILDLREDAKGGVQVAGLSEVTTRSTNEVIACNDTFIWISNILILSVPDESYTRNRSCALYFTSTFLL